MVDKMLVAFDVGNTNINVGVFEGKKLTKQWRIETDVNKTFDEYGVLLLQLFHFNNVLVSDIEGIIVSSVVPDIMFNLEKGIRKYLNLEPMVVSNNLKLGIDIKYENPQQLGADRICGAVAAYSLYGGPVIVVDMGTATTVNVVSSKGEFLGGAITLGLSGTAQALSQKAAKLPKIHVDKPTKAIATNTIEGIKAGLIYGYAGLVDNLVKKAKQELNEENVTVIGTGGLIQYIVDEVECINEIYDDLILEGLRIIFERNR